MPPKNELLSNDFGKNKFLKNILEDVAKLSSDIRQPDKFAQIFCEAAKTQKSIDYAMRDVIVDLLGKDASVQKMVTSIVENLDRNYGRILLGKVGWGIWTIMIMVIEGVILSYFK